MTTTTLIREHINGRLQAISPALPNLSVEGKRYTPKAADSFVRSKLFLAESTKPGIGLHSMVMLNGYAQVDVFVPVIVGYAAGDTIAQSIVAAFPSVSSTLLNGNMIRVQMAWVEAASEEDGHLRFPVFIRWEAYSR